MSRSPRSQWSHLTSNSLQTVRRTPECNIDTRGLPGTMSTGGAPSPLVICFKANKFVVQNRTLSVQRVHFRLTYIAQKLGTHFNIILLISTLIHNGSSSPFYLHITGGIQEQAVHLRRFSGSKEENAGSTKNDRQSIGLSSEKMCTITILCLFSNKKS